ncbi:hypothetical protein B0H66DRAFT_89831 [Apodospora peruviana]|uniref:F-box domain-containing protein n=1 Tax=Apodospora peruviana TaxID=516989 RepID=A0AAE0ITR9_9PEZI|nr:hypothetical protein B0H66DRAFT_89831 [Apodospora peruviana]
MVEFSSTPTLKPAASMASLSTELVTLILEELHDIDPQPILNARFVCRGFNDITTPFVYETVQVNERVIRPDAARLFPRTLKLINNFTRHVVLRNAYDRQTVSDFLDRLERLESIRWRYIDNIGPFTDLCTPPDVTRLKNRDPDKVRLHVDSLPLSSLDGKHSDIYRRLMPPLQQLDSLKMVSQLPAVTTTRLPALKRLLLDCPSIREFRYHHRGQGTQLSFKGAERLPPFTTLALRSYDWTHDAHEVAAHWDFSRLRSLKLISLPVFDFLSSVYPADLKRLHTLHLDDFSAAARSDDPNGGSKHATRLVYTLVKNHIRALRSLRATCHTALFPVDALLVHKRSLRDLLFRDHVGFAEENRRCPTLRVTNLVSLSQVMAALDTLEQDMDIFVDRLPFLLAICAFPQLQTLVLNVQTVVKADDVTYRHCHEKDPDLNRANDIFGVLVDNKMGYKSWRRITLIVGGWKRVMVRRLGENWRMQNRGGIFTERCFVMESSPKGNDQLKMNELRCISVR